MALFNRRVEVLLGDRLLSGLRIGFRVRRSNKLAADDATVRIWNANATSASQAQEPAVRVVLRAGYGDGQPAAVFVGTPIREGVATLRAGPDRILRLELSDGATELNQVVTLAYATAVDLGTVLQRVSDETGLALGYTAGLSSGLQLPFGISYRGPVSGVLQRLAGASGASLYVRDGAIQVTADAEPTTAPLISASRGNLVGVPERQNDGKVRVTALLDASIVPGTVFSVDSETYAGELVAEEVVLEGDSGWEQPFYTRAIGRPRAA